MRPYLNDSCVFAMTGHLLSLEMSSDLRQRLPQHEQRSCEHELSSELEGGRARIPLDFPGSTGTVQPQYGAAVDRDVC